GSGLGGRALLVGFQRFIETPDEISDHRDQPLLLCSGRHQLLQKALSMDPTQCMIADTELSGIVGHDHRICHQAVMADGAPKPCFGKGGDLLAVENIDTFVSQMRHERYLVAEVLRLKRPKPMDYGRIAATFFQIIECGVTQHIILIAAAQQGQKVQA
ncbi:hypothetical protein ACC687_37230, partial [Rhizobium ruizarguesonis]